MAQRKKNTARVQNKKPTTDRLKGALAKRPKAELIDVIVEIAGADRGLMRQLESRFGVETPPAELSAATRVAIADATDFDEREINYNRPINTSTKRKRVSRLPQTHQPTWNRPIAPRTPTCTPFHFSP